MSHYYGASGYIELSISRAYDPRGGVTLVRRFKGLPLAIQALQTLLISHKVKTQLEPSEDGGYDILQALYGAEDTQSVNEALSDKWELAGNDLEKTIWQLPKVQAEFSKLNLNSTQKIQFIAVIKSWIEALIRGERTAKGVDGQDVTISVDVILAALTAEGLNTTIFGGLIADLSRGVESYPLSQWVLRHTVIVTANTNIRPAIENVGKIFPTTLALTSSESVPNTLLFILPSGIWLKRTPTVEQVTFDKWQINQEWWHADFYSHFIFDTAD